LPRFSRPPRPRAPPKASPPPPPRCAARRSGAGRRRPAQAAKRREAGDLRVSSVDAAGLRQSVESLASARGADAVELALGARLRRRARFATAPSAKRFAAPAGLSRRPTPSKSSPPRTRRSMRNSRPAAAQKFIAPREAYMTSVSRPPSALAACHARNSATRRWTVTAEAVTIEAGRRWRPLPAGGLPKHRGGSTTISTAATKSTAPIWPAWQAPLRAPPAWLRSAPRAE